MSSVSPIIKNLLLKSTRKSKELYDKKSYNKEIVSKKKILLETNLSQLLTTLTPRSSTNSKDLLIFYVINITFLRANTIIQLSDARGKSILFFNAGDVGLVGKQKRQRKLATTRLIQLLFTKIPHLTTFPVAVHLKNVRAHKVSILEHLKKFSLIRIVRNFTQIPYNGCRKKKIQRKKYTRNIIK